jgi:hypothetical protein
MLGLAPTTIKLVEEQGECWLKGVLKSMPWLSVSEGNQALKRETEE